VTREVKATSIARLVAARFGRSPVRAALMTCWRARRCLRGADAIQNEPDPFFCCTGVLALSCMRSGKAAKMRSILAFMLAALSVASLPGCGAATLRSSGEQRTVEHLDRVIAFGSDRQFPVDLAVRRVSGGTGDYWKPANIEEASAELVRMLPASVSSAASNQHETSACAFSGDDFDEGYADCTKALCARLPEGAQDLPCSFFGRLEVWVQEHWLGGLCSAADWRVNTPLAHSLKADGLRTCPSMSTAIMSTFYKQLAGVVVDHEHLTRVLQDREVDH